LPKVATKLPRFPSDFLWKGDGFPAETLASIPWRHALDVAQKQFMYEVFFAQWGSTQFNGQRFA
jgi:hypothetical protein